MTHTFDLLQIALWSLVYVECIFFGLRRRDGLIQMPFAASALNIAWEFNRVLYPPPSKWKHMVRLSALAAA